VLHLPYTWRQPIDYNNEDDPYSSYSGAPLGRQGGARGGARGGASSSIGSRSSVMSVIGGGGSVSSSYGRFEGGGGGQRGAEVENERERSTGFASVAATTSHSLGSTPCWLEVVLRQRAYSEELVATVNPNEYTAPVLPFLSETHISRYEALSRCLALQDLARVARSCPLRRRALFAPLGKWSEVAFAVTALIDAITVQVCCVENCTPR
jgi:hypothetical protein